VWKRVPSEAIRGSKMWRQLIKSLRIPFPFGRTFYVTACVCVSHKSQPPVLPTHVCVCASCVWKLAAPSNPANPARTAAPAAAAAGTQIIVYILPFFNCMLNKKWRLIYGQMLQRTHHKSLVSKFMANLC